MVDDLPANGCSGGALYSTANRLLRYRERVRPAERGTDPEFTPAAKELLAEAGCDPAEGARPTDRGLQRLVESQLAAALLKGRFGEGDLILAKPAA